MGQWNVTRRGAVAVVAMDDGKANALALPEWESLSKALAEVRASDAAAMVLTGRPGFFSAGLNLKVLPTLEVGALMTTLRAFARMVGDELFMMPIPTVAAMSGHAIAAGAMLGLACDVRLFARGAFKFGLNEVPGGLPLPSCGVELMRLAVAPPQLIRLTLHGVMLDPDQALAHGLCEAVLDSEQLMPAALERAAALAELPRSAYAATKQKLRGPTADYLRRTLEPEMAELGRAMGAKA